MKRWPCVNIATRSTLWVRTKLMISFAGSPQRQHMIHYETFGLQTRGTLFEISTVRLDLLAFGRLELIEISGDPAVGDGA
jgi:hypothetical protein